KLRTVTNGGHRFACMQKSSCKLNSLVIGTQLIRIEYAARQQQCVEVLRIGFVQRGIYLKFAAPMRMLPGRNRHELRRNDKGCGSGFFESFARLGKLKLFKTIGD